MNVADVFKLINTGKKNYSKTAENLSDLKACWEKLIHTVILQKTITLLRNIFPDEHLCF